MVIDPDLHYDFSQLKYMTSTQSALVTCAHAVQLAFSNHTHSVPIKDAWLKLHAAAEEWQNNLDVDAQPILVIDGVKAANANFSGFPVIILTNRASFYSSFLHHLTCFLLLQIRPHYLRQTQSRILKTIPLHAVYLCGISTSNRLTWSWDPITVTTLLYAGKSLSYIKQQEGLLGHLGLLRNLTGWKMDNEIQKLSSLWKSGY
jgi:hypothetical protein